MAIWQYQLALIPSSWSKEALTKFQANDEVGGYDFSPAWKNHQPNDSIEMLFGAILPLGKTWDSDLIIWGDAERNDIQVWKEGGDIESISIRIDVRNIDLVFIEKVIQVSRQLNCVLFSFESKTLIKPDLKALLKEISESKSSAFVTDPHKFLNQIE